MKITFKDLEDSNCVGVTDYCRLLVSENKEDLNQTVEVYRGDMLCLIVKDIKKAATIMAKDCKWIKYDRTRRKATQEPRRAI